MTKSNRAAAILITFISWSAALADGSGEFTTTDTDVVSRFFHNAGLIDDGTVLITGGMTLQIFPPSLISLDAISQFDPETNQIDAYPVSLLTARSSHTQTLLHDGRVFITGGHIGASGSNPGTPTSIAELIDPSGPSVAFGPGMLAARAMHTATLLPDGRVVVAGGSAFEIFSPGASAGRDAWTANVPLQRTRTAHAAVLLEDFPSIGQARVLLIGGAGNGSTTLELVDPAHGNPTSSLMTATLTIGVDDLAATRLTDGSVLIVGGQNLITGDTIGLTYVYDPTLDQLTPIDPPPNLPAGVADHQLIRLGTWVALFGGESQTNGTDTELDTCAILDTQSLMWTHALTMNFQHDDFPAVKLDEQNVLLPGGGATVAGQGVPSIDSERFTLTRQTEGDIDGDGDVDFDDFTQLLASWGDPGCGGQLPCPADLDGDGDVDFDDFTTLLANWT